MEQIPQKDRNMHIWKIAALVTLLCACICLGGVALFGGIFGTVFGTLSTMEKTYYPDCETLGSDACQACCKGHGHSGYSAGEILNAPGKQCGCL